jgi:parallel beta-helix repeat protein
MLTASKIDTHIDVKSDTTFDVIGDYFKVKLSDKNNKSLVKTKVTFTVNGKTYNKNTDSSGIASLQLRLDDGTYKIVTKFAGSSKYKASSLTTTIKMANTRIVDAGLTNSQIQSIIDNAKVNNVILFKGKSYSDINLIITKSLTLVSNVDTTLKSGSSSQVITIKGKDASLTTVKGFRIEGSGDGVKVDEANHVKIINNKISTKGNGIVSLNTKNLNVTKNDISGNGKAGLSLVNAENSYILNNIISNNYNGIEITKSKNTYIYHNTISSNKNDGILLTSKLNGVNYGSGPEGLFITKNSIMKNNNDGIEIDNAGNNINILGNNITHNEENGITLNAVGDNTIQSNIITDNRGNGIRLLDSFVKPTNEDISYNAIFNNVGMAIEAKETYYEENGRPLSLGDNWYTDYSSLCPKVNSNNLKFVLSQVGKNTYAATFYDSDGNIASLLPDRTLTYEVNGQKYSITLNGGTGLFTVDADDNDKIKASVDRSNRESTYNSQKADSDTSKYKGKPLSYDYPKVPNYQLYEDIDGIQEDENQYDDSQYEDSQFDDNGLGNGAGEGNGNGNGDGNGGSGNGLGDGKSRNGNSNSGNDDFTGNSTSSQNMDPGKSSSANVNQVSQSSGDVDVSASQASSSAIGGSSNSNPNANPSADQSVVKQITIDDDEIVICFTTD